MCLRPAVGVLSSLWRFDCVAIKYDADAYREHTHIYVCTTCSMKFDHILRIFVKKAFCNGTTNVINSSRSMFPLIQSRAALLTHFQRRHIRVIAYSIFRISESRKQILTIRLTHGVTCRRRCGNHGGLSNEDKQGLPVIRL